MVQQWEFEVWWRQTDALYFFTDGIPAYVIDEEVFVQWSSAVRSDVSQVFGRTDTTTLATYHALMLSLALFCRVSPVTDEISPDIDEKKVFSAMVVFVHPSQKLSLIEEAVDMPLVVSCDPESVPAMSFCHLPKRSIREFYPCPTHDAALVLPFSMGQDGPILHLNTPICHCNKFTIRSLHQWVCLYGHAMVLPPLYSRDSGLPNVYALEELPMLWTNTEYLAAASNDDMSKVGHPAMTLVSTSCLEVDANSSQISLTDNEEGQGEGANQG